ncbi:MAG: F0F1 ATP synthase subunit epsilon [Deltaproteobacteria bacterium]|nr:F0F1 ATP synthase subunit epsilon [Deltaproteobacteria bacterium]MCZ6450981.1 F0F1 ATP synthase subunit epsilon [Deltaproteobacteria bacterium]MCZ6621934.1 F0F1 ATP synthase subunit epsilon [Deltaproteobacteria bacterium]
MAEKIQLRLVTPSRLLLDEVVDEVTAPGVLGEFGVLPNHIAFLATLEIGEMSYKQGVQRVYLALSGGYAEVLDNVMTVLANAAEFGGEIDVERAREARERTEKKLEELNREDKEFAMTEAALHRALLRLQIAAKAPRH